MTTTTRIAIPTKGRLSGPSLDLLRAAGLVFETSSGALSVVARNVPIEVLFVRAEDIPDLVCNGVAEYGITGLDLVVESGVESAVLQDLRFGRCTLTAAVQESSKRYHDRRLRRPAGRHVTPSNRGPVLCRQGH